MIGKTESYILEQIEKNGAVHVTLIDPEKTGPDEASLLAKECEACGSSAILIGGSTITSSSNLDSTVKDIKKNIKIPVVLFPNNLTGISKHADAILFMSLLNSSDQYFIVGVQVLAAPLIMKYGIEAIPLGYLIVGEGGTAAVIGKASSIPYDKTELSVAHSLAAKYLGMRFIYLEGGSGVSNPVPTDMVRMVKTVVGGPLIVGGGIRTGNQARDIVAAGADVIVTSTILEKTSKGSIREKMTEIMEGIKEGVKNKKIR